MEPRPPETIAEALAAALPAYDHLAELGEAIEDEWSYVNDLATAWRDRLADVADAHGNDRIDSEEASAIDALSAEADAVDDPHRAIDWLSTYPQVLLVAFGEAP